MTKALHGRAPTRLGHLCVAVDIRQKYARASRYEPTAVQFTPFTKASRPYTIRNGKVLPTDSTTTTTPHVLPAWMLHQILTMQQDLAKRIKTVQQRCKTDHNRKMATEPKKIETGQYVHVDGPPMKTSATERLVMES